jgi:hypothetical protein
VQFSLRSLMIFMAIAGVLCWITYLATRPFVTLARLDCGQGRHVELLRPNEFCDLASPLHFRFTGMANPERPPSCCYWGCGYDSAFVVVQGASADIIGVAPATSPDELLLLIDFKTREYWPRDLGRDVTPEAGELLESIRGKKKEIWLDSTYDSRLTKPRQY